MVVVMLVVLETGGLLESLLSYWVFMTQADEVSLLAL